MLDGNLRYGLVGRAIRDEDQWQKRERELKEGRDLCRCMALIKGKWILQDDGTRKYICIRCKRPVY
ncbi:MAG: hypothetical protein SCK28_05305 [Bacillota bacterium]|nr:hypothetical protein [Bacillota bacterium]